MRLVLLLHPTLAVVAPALTILLDRAFPAAKAVPAVPVAALPSQAVLAALAALAVAVL